MKLSNFPMAPLSEFCEGLDLCSARIDERGNILMGVKKIGGQVSEARLESVINSDSYDGKRLIRTYSSGHIFLSESLDSVYLVTTQKDSIIQHQFTGGSPLEEDVFDVISKIGGIYSFNVNKVRLNAERRTKNRTGVLVQETFNDKPLVDWVLMESIESGEIYYKLICLMHFIVKTYSGILSVTHEEATVDGNWFPISQLATTQNIAPNVPLVTGKAVDFILLQEKNNEGN